MGLKKRSLGSQLMNRRRHDLLFFQRREKYLYCPFRVHFCSFFSFSFFVIDEKKGRSLIALDRCTSHTQHMRHASLLFCQSIFFLLLLLWTRLSVSGVMFDLGARSYKCFTEELPNEYEVSGSFNAMPGYNQFVDFRITNPEGASVVTEHGTNRGDFNFITDSSGDYHFCFYNRLVSGTRFDDNLYRTIRFETRLGADAKSYEDIVTKDHLKPLELELRIMEDSIKSISNEYIYFKEREAEMRKISEKLNRRSAWITFLTFLFVAFFSWWQVKRTKKFLRAKWLIV